MSTCNHQRSAPDQTIDSLHEAQEGVQRHKCCECAYEAGYQLGITQAVAPGGNAVCSYTDNRAPSEEIEALPAAQAGLSRHKCAVCAFQAGFAAGRGSV